MTHALPSFLKQWKIDAIGAVSGIGLAVGLYYLGFLPLSQAHELAAKLDGELTEQRQKASDLAGKLGSMRTRERNLAVLLEQTPLKLDPGDRLNQRIATLTTLAGECGLQIDDVAAGDAVHGQRYDTVPIRLAGSASYTTCAAFLHRLHGQFGDMGVAGFDVTAQAHDASGGATFQFRLIWYAMPATVAEK